MTLTAARNGRVTVVLPTHNRAALLPRAIETALAQTVIDRCDVVVVDDGSTDETLQIAARYARHIRYLRQPNAGVSSARNHAIRTVPNEFVAFLDDDDLWAADKLALQLAALAHWPQAVLVTAGTVERLPDGRERPHAAPAVPRDEPADFAPDLFEQNFLPPSAVLARTQAVVDAGLFRSGLRRAEDHHLWVRMACRGPGVLLSTPLTTYSVGSPAALSGDAFKLIAAQLRTLYLLQGELRRRPDCRPRWQRAVARAVADLRDRAFRERRYGVAARLGLRALLQRPTRCARWEWGRFLQAAAGACTER